MPLGPPKIEMLWLLRNPRNLGELSELIGKSKQATLHHLKPLLELGLVERMRSGVYRTSKLGQILFEFGTRLEKFERVVKAAGRFFIEHELSAIPTEIFENIYMLDGCRINVRENPYELGEVEGILADSDWVKGLSSVYHERFPEFFASLTDGRNVELVLTKDVFNVVVERAKAKLNEFLKRGKMYVCDNVRLAFVVAERGFALALYRLDGVYDAQNILICRTEDAVRWGLRLFEYYRSISREIK
ncbi:helix-turn-helix transcriptional regulator [Archaeoglobus neptunius]|uniref:helix-turn-helix transcriptional regulator n=1 Tax=Archaeoglobus neptunius TaxID=2798580 RepID=UPI001926F630|nr:transcriptional regulator FilR1 domain-containing protein [Archaeoglobus neptunius]